MDEVQASENTTARDIEPQRREPVFNLPPVVVALVALCVLAYALGEYVFSEATYLSVLQYGAFIPVRYGGQVPVDVATFTSLVSYSFLHGSIAHLVINMIWLAAFGSPLANRLGAPRFLLFWAVTSACAAAMYWAFHMWAPVVLVGASGAISGMMGAAARFGFRIDRSRGVPAFSGSPLPVTACLRSRAVVAFLTVWMLVNLLTGLVRFAPGIDDQIAWEAHIGGFLVGFFGIEWFDRRERKLLPPLDPPDEHEEREQPN